MLVLGEIQDWLEIGYEDLDGMQRKWQGVAKVEAGVQEEGLTSRLAPLGSLCSWFLGLT